VEPVTLDYTPELFTDISAHTLDYWQTGWTVCGAEDPAVIALDDEFGELHQEFQGFTIVRVIDRYVSPWKSDTLLEFSTREMTEEEYSLYDEIAGEE